MKKNRLVTVTTSLLFAGAAAVGLTGCGETAAAPAATVEVVETDYVTEVAEAPAEVDVAEDLHAARDAVAENLNWGDQSWDQIMLADDVPSPEMKYGLLVVPFHMTDAGARHTRTVSIANGNFVIDVTSADTGITWQIDQDGNISQAN